MKLVLFIIPLMAAFTPAYSDTVTVTFDPKYDISFTPTSNVLCGGELSANYPTYRSFPGYPNIGGASDITSTNTAACGACRQLTYTNNGKDNSIYFTVIDGDHNTNAVALSSEAYKNLTGPAFQPTSITATVGYVDGAFCGFK